ncbi:hypothetical protein [Paenibacillus dokdonensis]|uniref:hypothetical protein n=1 Tax=Paenibacillus dokdonensis TaxID=2567944 RepID=UPI0010A9315B|nr:hypothetical protein [Paenibacillus dokdonensis]
MPSFFHKSTNSLPHPLTTLELASTLVYEECRQGDRSADAKEWKKMAKETTCSDRKPHTVLKKVFRITGLMVLCWCVLFACSESAVLAYDAIVKRLVE